MVAISNDETGISEDPDVRFEVAKKIVQRAQDFGIKPQDVVVDPLVMPIGALGGAGLQVFSIVRKPARRARRQLDLWRLKYLLRPAQPSWLEFGVLGHGRRRRHDLGHYEPAARGGKDSGSWLRTCC